MAIFNWVGLYMMVGQHGSFHKQDIQAVYDVCIHIKQMMFIHTLLYMNDETIKLKKESCSNS